MTMREMDMLSNMIVKLTKFRDRRDWPQPVEDALMEALRRLMFAERELEGRNQ
jgi:hypothetical protein